MPPVYDVTVFSKEDDREIYHDKVLAIDEDTAIDQVTDALNKKGVSYGVCMAEEI
ncbi:MAG: hypothetical protein HDQ96_08030 [Lachnospiraceae bacterium]|nr:hypothetical protein [Lachnospiraceae bacterium]